MLGQRANSIIDTLQQIASGGQTGIQPQQSPTLAGQTPYNTGLSLETKAALDEKARMAGIQNPAFYSTRNVTPYQPQRAPQEVGSALAKPTMPPEVQEKAQVAEAVARKAAANPEAAADPTFAEKVKGYFGNEENMLRLAMAFNTMRMEPDQQLGAYLGARLGKIQESKVSAAGAKDIASQLLKMGYPDYAKQVLANPNMAKDIYKQIIQKELKPEAAEKVSGVQYDTQGNAYVVVTAQGKEPQIKMLGIQGDTLQDKLAAETGAMNLRTNWDISIKKSENAMEKAGALREQIGLFDEAIVQAEAAQAAGSDVGGIIRSRFPSFNKETAAFRSAANQLGISVINSATFGALSEKELQLALSTKIDQNLSGQDLIDYMERKRAATVKLYEAMMEEASRMSSMPYNEYIEDRKQRYEANKKYINMKAPKNVDPAQWALLSADERRQVLGE